MVQQPTVETRSVACVTDAERRLVQSLVASHGIAFAESFRAEYANEIASAWRQLAVRRAGADAARGKRVDELAPVHGADLAHCS